MWDYILYILAGIGVLSIILFIGGVWYSKTLDNSIVSAPLPLPPIPDGFELLEYSNVSVPENIFADRVQNNELEIRVLPDSDTERQYRLLDLQLNSAMEKAINNIKCKLENNINKEEAVKEKKQEKILI